MILRLYSKAIHIVQLSQIILAYDCPACQGILSNNNPMRLASYYVSDRNSEGNYPKDA